MIRYLLSSFFLVGLFLLCFDLASAQSFPFQQKIVALERDSADFLGISVAMTENWLITGATGEDISLDGGTLELEQAGAAYIFRRSTSDQAWEQHQRLVATDPSREDEFGLSVALSDDYALVGTIRVDEDDNGENTLMDAGAVYIFERQANDEWLPVQKLVAPDRNTGDNFGRSVALAGDYAFVGAPNTDVDEAGENLAANAGGVYIFERQNSGQWEMIQKITPADRDDQDLFGWSVGVHAGQMIVGAYAEDHNVEGAIFVNNAGAAYFFAEQAPGNWVQTQKVIALERGIQHFFGSSVDIYQNYAIVGASDENVPLSDGSSASNAGAAYVFHRNEMDVWTLEDQLLDPVPTGNDYLGFDVAIRPPYAVAGAYRESYDNNEENMVNGAGAAFLFRLDEDNSWNYQEKLLAPDRNTSDFMGRSVAITEDEIVVGAFRHSEGVDGAGSVPLAGAVFSFTDLSTGVEHLNPAIEIQLSPNPASDFCRIEIDQAYPNVSLSLYNLQGQLLQQFVIQDQSVFEFSLQHLPSGAYLLRLDTEGAFLANKKIIVR